MNIIKSATNPILFRLYTLKSLPSLFFWGVKIEQLNRESCAVNIRQSWRTQNPFRSIYFSALNGAAELSTGMLVVANCPSKEWSTLVVGMEASFTKKAVGKIIFSCVDGYMIQEKVKKAGPEGTQMTLTSTGTDEAGDIVATMKVTWSVRKRRS